MTRKAIACISVFLLVLFLIGLTLFCWPRIQGAQQQKVVQNGLLDWESLYNDTRTTLGGKKPEQEPGDDEERILPELYDAMVAYNEEIFENKQVRFNSRAEYAATVIDVTQYGVEAGPVGSIEIPKIDIKMPLYLGASDDNLAKGFAQMGQTSLPTGGENTNCVVAAHRGWGSAPYLRDVHLVEIGDSVFLETFWETMEYRVTGIEVIEPSDIQKLLIQSGKDMLTIFTCTPYGVGSHRHVLYCERYFDDAETKLTHAASFQAITPETNPSDDCQS